MPHVRASTHPRHAGESWHPRLTGQPSDPTGSQGHEKASKHFFFVNKKEAKKTSLL
jgi:hypothetical protein